MNKKGFTLIELLATIGILVIMSTIIGVNIVSILNSTEELNENNVKKELEKAACVFVDSEIRLDSTYNNKYTSEEYVGNVSVSDLITSELIPDKAPYNTDYKDSVISVIRTDGKKCTLK